MSSEVSHKILVVCLGNICRSPLAEGLIQLAANEAQLNWEVASAGTGHWHIGKSPDPRSIAVAKQHGLDISAQRAQQVSAKLLDEYDLVLAMDRSNYRHLTEMATTATQRKKIKLLLEYTALSATHGHDVFDPYWDDSGFEGVYKLLEKAAKIVIELKGRI